MRFYPNKRNGLVTLAALIYHKLSEETKQHVTVALTGTGGDELFGGYNRYRALKLMNFINKVPLNLNL